MKALIVVDIQNDFCKNGALEVHNANSIIPIINKVINYFNENKLLVVATMDWHPREHKSFATNSNGNVGDIISLNGLSQVLWPIHCVQNSFGAELHPELLKIDNIVYKGTNPEIDSYSGFFDNGHKVSTALLELLKSNNITELFIVGLATDYCVKYTVLDALELGFKVTVFSNCCKGVNLSPDDSEKALLEMKEKGAHIEEWN